MLEQFKFDEVRAEAIIVLDKEIRDQTLALIKEEDDTRKDEISGRIGKLVAVRNELKYEGKAMKGLDPTVLVSGTIGLIGIVMMLQFEKDDIIGSKALPNIGKWFGM